MVRRATAALDPVTLELSAPLHPSSPVLGLWTGVDPTLWLIALPALGTRKRGRGPRGRRECLGLLRSAT